MKYYSVRIATGILLAFSFLTAQNVLAQNFPSNSLVKCVDTGDGSPFENNAFDVDGNTISGGATVTWSYDTDTQEVTLKEVLTDKTVVLNLDGSSANGTTCKFNGQDHVCVVPNPGHPSFTLVFRIAVSSLGPSGQVNININDGLGDPYVQLDVVFCKIESKN